MINTAYPLIAQIYLTLKCNLRCKHCLYDCNSDSPTISFDDLKKVIEILRKLKVLAIIVNGGEPLLYPYFDDMLSFLYKNEFGWELLTNGTLLSVKKAKIIAEHEPYKISISLHGGDAQTHNWLTKGGFKKTVEGIINLRKHYDGEILVQSLMHPKRNKNEFIKLINFCGEYNLKVLIGDKILPLGRAWKNWHLFKNNVPEFDYDSLIPENLKFKPHTKNNFILVVSSILNDFRGHRCGAGGTEIYIDPEGYVYGCCNFINAKNSPKRGGNILHTDPVKLWRYDPFLNETRDIHPLGCFYKDRCELWKQGKCPHCFGISLQLTNTYNYPHPLCFDYIKNNIDPEFIPILYTSQGGNEYDR